MGDKETLLLDRVQRGGIAMSLKHLNLGSSQPVPPKGWTPDKRFVAYEYGPFRVQGTPLPQQPTSQTDNSQPLKDSSLGADVSSASPRSAIGEELDFQIAMKRRTEPSGASLAEMANKYGL